MMREGALKNIKVLDLGRVLAGPLCSAILGDLGADVVKLESLQGDLARTSMPLGGYFAVFNRSKRGITLNLKSEKGKAIVRKLVREVDVVVENFRPGVMKKLGLDYDRLKEINPGLIYAAVSGYGQEGPYSQRAGLDPAAQAMSGIMSVTGFPGSPSVRCGASICDVMAGLHAVIGILAALNHRTLTGKGQMIDVSLCDAGVVGMSSVFQQYLTTGEIPSKLGNSYVAYSPGGCYQAADGEVVINGAQWEMFCKAIEREDLLADPDYKEVADRVKNRDKLDEIINAWTGTRTVAQVLDIITKNKNVAAPVLNVNQVVADEHIGGVRNMFTTVHLEGFGDVKITNQCIKMSETPAEVSDPPSMGQHNSEIYRSLGFTEEEIGQLREEHVI